MQILSPAKNKYIILWYLGGAGGGGGGGGGRGEEGPGDRTEGVYE